MIRLVTETNKDICCFLANTPQDRENGLVGWGKLPVGSGLLFEFSKTDFVVFHMSTVLFPIDIVMIDENGYVRFIFENCQPGSSDRFQGTSIKWVLELPANDVVRLSLKVGSKLSRYDSYYEFSPFVKGDLLSVHAAYNGFRQSGVAYGAAISQGSSVIAWGWNKTKISGNPTHHAEMVAISDALARDHSIKGSACYTTSQPCMMCAGALAWSEFSNVYWLRPSNHTTLRTIANHNQSSLFKMSPMT